MQRLFQKLDERVRRFLDQREVLHLLVQSTNAEHGYLLKTLQTIDESSPHLFWLFSEPFADAASYVDAVVATFGKRRDALAQKIEEAGEAPWPPLPPRVLDPSAPPATRLQTLLLYARKRIADLEATHLVAAFVPAEVRDPARWRLLLRELVTYDEAAPWCHHMRLITREDKAAAMPPLHQDLRERVDLTRFPSTEVHPIDLSLEALQRSVKEDAADKTLPIADRAHALLVDGMVDYAHQRYREAMAKYELVRQFFAYVGHGPLLALTLNAIGELFARVGMKDKALEHFEMAVTPAAESKSYPVLLNISVNLGNLHLANEDWPKAEEHYVAADALATGLLSATVKLGCMESIGACRKQRGDYAGAQKAWQDGVLLARTLEENDARKRMLVRLRDMYREANMRDRVRQVEDELRGLS